VLAGKVCWANGDVAKSRRPAKMGDQWVRSWSKACTEQRQGQPLAHRSVTAIPLLNQPLLTLPLSLVPARMVQVSARVVECCSLERGEKPPTRRSPTRGAMAFAHKNDYTIRFGNCASAISPAVGRPLRAGTRTSGLFTPSRCVDSWRTISSIRPTGCPTSRSSALAKAATTPWRVAPTRCYVAADWVREGRSPWRWPS
jgi:hypothetical protein